MWNKVNSLYGKISAIFLLLLLVIGAVQVRVFLQTSMEFAAEADQKLNHDLARDLAKHFEPFLADSLDEVGIGHSFHDLMVMNPRVELYLLDETGGLLAYFADPVKIKRMAVSIAPIKAFLQADDNAPMPIYGDDPRSPDKRKPFSVTPVLIGGKQHGYLYVILGGEEYDSVSAMLKNSYIVKTSASILGWVFAGALLAGLLLFFLLTRRLRSMTDTVDQFARGDYQQRITVGSSDELGQLGRSFNQMADALVESIASIKMNDALRRELVANVSHDLRTPLASIQGYLETIFIKKEDLDEERRQQFLDIIYQNTTMLNRLVGELFELSKLDAKQSEPEIEPFSLAELVQDTVMEFRPLAEEHGIEIKAEYSQDLPLVRGDIGMIARVLTNLIENALHYTEQGTVTVLLAGTPSSVEIRVQDTGRGIPREDQPHIFNRFYRVEKGRSSAPGGTGLGLAIAQKIAQAHNSEIYVESLVDQGTTFRFALDTH
ncbi:MAG TPA: HAMP domain-containing histidine kinase [Candidatus Latescibacteria bacterium]|nr:HAMP domain-containing histidine kinase [Candidatus Handelsmanbacteria bacterium]HIL09523.1 HAMP domain-containing histidine kinase [Candidatus Latescibacterota bacterium]